MKLLQLQREMARSIMRPLAGSDRIAPDTDARFIRANDRLTPEERLEIYCRSYWFRILDSLYDDFPGLRAVLGPQAFSALSRAYLADCPSRSFTLRNLGARLENWLTGHAEYGGRTPALALDMVRLEWAHIEAFDNAAAKVLGPEDLLELGTMFRAGLQPYVRLLSLQYPVDNLRVQVNRATDEREAVSNTAIKQNHRSLAKKAGRLQPAPIFLAVHRLDDTVYYRRLAAEEYRLLIAIGCGRTIGRAIPEAFANSPVSGADQLAKLEGWFAAWSAMGWLCAPAVAVRKKVR